MLDLYGSGMRIPFKTDLSNRADIILNGPLAQQISMKPVFLYQKLR
jgi:hypothetical protein